MAASLCGHTSRAILWAPACFAHSMDASTAMRPRHLHAEMGDAPALNACGSHDLAVDLDYEPGSVGIPDRLDPNGPECVAVDGELSPDVAPFRGHGFVQVQNGVDVGGRGAAHCELPLRCEIAHER